MSGPYFRTAIPQPIPELFTFDLFKQFPEVQHGISTRYSEAHQRYDVGVQQRHGTDFTVVQSKRAGKKTATADAIIVTVPEVTIRIGTSDCVPMIIYEPGERRGAVIHAGIKGTTQGILENVLTQFDARQVYLGLGPAIGLECYDQIDLQLENVLQAQRAGVPLAQIEVMRWCTKCHHDIFFSYRAGDHRNFGTYFRLAKI